MDKEKTLTLQEQLLKHKRALLERQRIQRRIVDADIEQTELDINNMVANIRNMRDGVLPVVHYNISELSDGGIEHIFSSCAKTVDRVDIPQDMIDVLENNETHIHYISCAECFFEEDDFSVCLSMPLKKLTDGVANGKVRFIVGEYESPVLEDPTYFEALQYFQQSVYTTNNKHHIYLEDVRFVTDFDGVQVFKFITGS